MADKFNPKRYAANETVVTADNLNAIQQALLDMQNGAFPNGGENGMILSKTNDGIGWTDATGFTRIEVSDLQEEGNERYFKVDFYLGSSSEPAATRKIELSDLVLLNDAISINDDGYWVIKGEPTNKPAQGPEGKQGPQGETGAQGPQGEQGPVGPNGNDGKDGQSIARVEDADPGESHAVAYKAVLADETPVDGKFSIPIPWINQGNWWVGDSSTEVSATGVKFELDGNDLTITNLAGTDA